MTVHVETLEKLERKITLTLPAKVVQSEVDARLKRLARTVKMDGFRPGKVPMSVVTQRYGYSVHYEVMNDKVGEAFSQAANEAQLRVAGQPRITERETTPDGALAFDAVFEVFPDVKIGDLSSAAVEKITSTVSEEAIDKTLAILRKQRRTFEQRPQDGQAADGDRVTVDFEGKIDGEIFDGGKATGFQFLVGEGQMLKEFEEAVRGMKSGESKTFPLLFPAEYQSQDVAGKQADFMVTVQKIEEAHLPEIDTALAKSLGTGNETVEGLRADIKQNLEREVSSRLLARNKIAAMDALLTKTEFDLPTSSVQSELTRLEQNARADLKQRGIKDADKMPIPEDLFRPEAEHRVRLGLVLAELVRANDLYAKPEQVRAHLEELAASYESPAEVVTWHLRDRERMADLEALVTERNATTFILTKAQITEKTLSFDELMGQN